MKHVGVAILGLGVVGSGTYEILRDHRQMYQKTQNVDIVVENVLELRKERAIALGISEDKIASSIDTIYSSSSTNKSFTSSKYLSSYSIIFIIKIILLS